MEGLLRRRVFRGAEGGAERGGEGGARVEVEFQRGRRGGGDRRGPRGPRGGGES